MSLQSLLDHLGIDSDLIEVVDRVEDQDRQRFPIPPGYTRIITSDPNVEFDCS